MKYPLFLLCLPIICNALSFEDYLEFHNVFALHQSKIAGHVTDAQKFQMNEALASYTDIKSIAEIGLNAGHSTDNFFNHCGQLEKYISFDIEYIPEVVEYFSAQYKEQFRFIQGDSAKTVPAFSASSPEMKFDLIFIDGGHSFENCYHDIMNMHRLAHSETHLWIDDYHTCPEVFEAVQTCKDLYGILEVIKVHSSDRGTSYERSWIEARYLFP